MIEVQPIDEQIIELVGAHPLGLIVSNVDGEAMSTLIPMVIDGPGRSLYGHFGAKSPQLKLLDRQSRALVTFQGPSSYISPSWLRDRTQAPTWHYTFVEFLVEVELHYDEAIVRRSLEQLVEHLEQGRQNSWNMSELGARYEMLSRGVRPFTARILRARSIFKLSQRERTDVLNDSIEGLRREGKSELAAMVEAARQRAVSA